MRERLFSPLGLHAVGFGMLAIATIVLGIRVGLDWRATSSSNVDAMAGKQAELRTLELQTAPLRGLDKKVDLSRTQIDEFYAKRIPPSYSAILERLGELKAKGPVQSEHGLRYTQAKGSGDLTEIRMDAGVSGDYPGHHAVYQWPGTQPDFFYDSRHGVERAAEWDVVNLRLQVSTWLRPADAAGIPVEGQPSSEPSAPSDPVGDIAPSSPTASMREPAPGELAQAQHWPGERR